MYCTLFYSVYFAAHNDPGLWNVMSSIFRAQPCSLTCYAGWKGIVGGRQLWLIISLMQQIMNQRRQSLARDERWHNTEVNRDSKSVSWRKLLYNATRTFLARLFYFDSSITRMQCKWSWPATGWRAETCSLLSVTTLKYYNPKGSPQLARFVSIFLSFLQSQIH